MKAYMERDELNVPTPFAFNAWKHHLGFLRASIQRAYENGENGFQALLKELLRVGANTLDIYTGRYMPREIARMIEDDLKKRELFGPTSYRSALNARDDYMLIDLPDGSQWVLREGENPDLYIHMHPAKYQGPCRRFRANNIKTAAGVLARLGMENQIAFDPNDVSLELINEVRGSFPGLSPIVRLEPDTGPAELMRLLVEPIPPQP